VQSQTSVHNQINSTELNSRSGWASDPFFLGFRNRTCGPPLAALEPGRCRCGPRCWLRAEGVRGYGMLPALSETRTKADSRACGKAWRHLVRPAGAGRRHHYRGTHYNRCFALAGTERARTHDVFALDFMNNGETIQKAFVPYCRTALAIEWEYPSLCFGVTVPFGAAFGPDGA
jgi:hypothetical protein